MATLPSYGWGESPDHLLTRKQLAEQGLKPKRGAKPVARVYWRRGRDYANLFDKADAVEKKPPSEAQKAALAKAREAADAKRTCVKCGGKESMARDLIEGYCEWCWERVRWQRDKAKAIEAARQILANPDEYVILDTETTGLEAWDEVVEVAVLGMDGTVLFESRIEPTCEMSAGAQRVHGISREDLEGKPTFWDIYPALRDAIAGKKVLAYNARFDSRKLGYCVRHNCLYKVGTAGWLCAMELYAVYCGDWSDYYGSYKWQKLPGATHGAAEDCRATLAVIREMASAQGEG